MNTINNTFNKVVCINLLNRKDKKENMQTKFNKLGIKVEWFTAIQYGFANQIVDNLPNKLPNNSFGRFNVKQPNEFGAAMSHYTVIKTAYNEGVKNLFVFEDDAKFRENFVEEFSKSWDKLPNNWNMINLYSFMYALNDKNKRINVRWITSNSGWSLMAYGMDRKAMKWYIDSQDELFRIADLVSFHMQALSNLNIYSSIPTLCIPNQELGSNIRGDNMNYIKNKTVLNFGYNDEHFN